MSPERSPESSRCSDFPWEGGHALDSPGQAIPGDGGTSRSSSLAQGGASNTVTPPAHELSVVRITKGKGQPSPSTSGRNILDDVGKDPAGRDGGRHLISGAIQGACHARCPAPPKIPESQSVQGPPASLLRDARSARIVAQDFCPLAESIEWELSRLYYQERGSKVFLTGSDHVPYAINNDGNVSAGAAEVLFASLVAAERAGSLEPRLFLLELGVGTGLFSRYFLDSIRDLCSQHGKDYYDRLCYVATDQSERMLEDIGRRGVLANHAGHYRLAVLDAIRPDKGLASAIAKADCVDRPFRAVFVNYLLDILPCAVINVADGEARQLCVRTSLARTVDLSQHTPLNAEDIARRASSDDPNARRELLDIYRLFALEYDYRPVDLARIPYGDFVHEFAHSCRQNLRHNYGAIACLEGSGSLLREGGFVLINDYGQAGGQGTEDGYQRFAGSVAMGVNFALLKAYFQRSGEFGWFEPAEDNGHIYTRLLARQLAPETIDLFQKRFSKSAYDWAHGPEEEARRCLQHGRYEAALGEYCQALERQPRNWLLIAEVAKLLTLTLRDYSAGHEMARAGLAVNPISPDLWNTLGDSLFCLEQVDAAQEAFLRALELDPTDVRARFNLSYVYSHKKDYLSTLRVIADGLALDRTGEYRQQLLAKQGEILHTLEHGHREETRCLLDRVVASPETGLGFPSRPTEK